MSAKIRTKFLYSVFIFIALFMAASPIAPVFADPPDVKTQLAVSRWPNWVGLCGMVTPGGESAGTASGTGSSSDPLKTTKPGPVYIMGDSITEIAKPGYEKKFGDNNWSPTVEGLVSRNINTTPPSPDGLQQIEKDKDKIAKANAIVIALGTNSSGLDEGTMRQNVEEAMNAVYKYRKSSAPVYWVNILDTRSDSNSKTTNKAIEEGVGKNGTVIDWYSAAKKSADLSSFDLGVHPTKDSDVSLLVNLVYNAVSGGDDASRSGVVSPADAGCCPGSTGGTTGALNGKSVPDEQIPGADNREKIWNYLRSLGLSPNETAGIVGNIGREGVYDPQSIEDPGGTTKDWNEFLKLTSQTQGYGLIGFTPGVSLAKKTALGADWSGISKVKVNADNFYLISTQLDVVYGYMKNSPGAHGSMLAEYQAASTSPGAAALSFEDLVENPQVLASDERVQFAEDALKDFKDNPVIGPEGSSATSQCCPAGGSNAPGTTLEGNSAGEKIFNYMVSEEKFSNNAAAAATGNLQQESNFSTTVDNGLGYVGLAQWGGDRLTKLYAKDNWQDLEVQLKYVSEELHGGWKYALNKMLRDKKIEDLTYDWVKYYEGAVDANQPLGVQNYAERLAYAKNWLKKAGGDTSSSSSSGGCSSSADSGVYKNPFRDVKSLRPERIDMGVDYAGEGPVYALGAGTVMNLRNSGWNYGGYDAFISVKLSAGPAAGKYSYMAEACVPVDGLKIGQKVTADTVICKMINPSSTGIETGWAEPPGTGNALAISNGGYTEGYATELGENYNDLLVSLGVPSGTQQPKMGSLPSGWPTWKK